MSNQARFTTILVLLLIHGLIQAYAADTVNLWLWAGSWFVIPPLCWVITRSPNWPKQWRLK